MHTYTCRLAVALAALGLLCSTACAKDETVSTSPTTAPVTARSGTGSSSGTTEPADDVDDAGTRTGSYDEACSIIEQIDGLDDDAAAEQGLALFAEARDAGPDDLADDWDTLADTFGELFELDEDDPQDAARALELIDDPAFVEAATAIDAFAHDECGLDLGLGPAVDDAGSDGTDERPGDDEIGVPTDGSEDPTSIDAVQAHLADTYGTEAWWPVLDDASGWSATSGIDPTWTITLSASSDWDTLTTAELVAACDAVAGYLDTVEDTDVAVEILDPDEAVLVNRFFRDEACSAP